MIGDRASEFRLTSGICLLLAVGFLGCAATMQTPGEHAPLTSRQQDAALKALLGPQQFGEYVLITDTIESNEWLRRFWTAHDPTPTTPENEFRDEHERRVYHAIYLFGSHARGGPPWDDRGEVYIRYGQPDERVVRQPDEGGIDFGEPPPSAGSDDPFKSPLNKAGAATEIWAYYRWNETFQFEDKRGFGYFELAPVSDPSYQRQGPAEFQSTRLRAIDLQPAIYYHEYGKNLIDYALDVVRFRGREGMWRIDINLGYPLSHVGRGIDSVSISLRRTIVIRNEKQEEEFSEVGLISRRVGMIGEKNQLMIEQKTLDLKPGHYSIAVTIDDLVTGKAGTYLKDLRLPEYVVREVQEISDIEVASFVWSIYEPGSPFVKGGQMVTPLPSRVYLKDQSLAFYFEVYHLLLDPEGKTRYKIDYDITQIGGDKHLSSSEPGDLSGTTREVSHATTLDISDLPSGDYVLTVRVNDLVGKHEKSTVARFSKSD